MPYRKSPFFSLGMESRFLQAVVLFGAALVLVVVLQILLPWLILGALGWAGLWLWRRQQRYERALHQLFYELVQASGGRISVLDFAIAARLPGPQARAFLDARAREFYANFEPTEQGDLLYTFNVSGMSTSTSEEAESGKTAEPVVNPPAPASSAIFDVPASVIGPQTGAPKLGPNAILQLPLNDLASRLGCSLTLLDQKKWAADFARWSQDRDPERLSWRYDPLSNRFYCLP
ncbi:MAG TPA: hypothetical protein V6D06_02500 [Trichocoleus sp.]